MDTDQLNQLREAAALKLTMQAARASGFAAYWENEAGIIALLDTEERQTFRTFLAESGCNWAELIVNAVAERLEVVGFRMGSEDDNDLAWTLWQASQLDADAQLLQTDALVTGSSFLLVQPDDTNPTGVSLSVESPYQAAVLYEPGSRRKRLAGYKRYGAAADWGLNDWALANPAQLTGTGQVVEVLVTPDEIATWWPDSGGYPEVEVNPVGAVSMIEVRPQPRTLGPPRSEFEPVTSIIDRINTTTFNLMVSADYGAFRQIWATGIKIARKIVASPDGTTTTQALRPFDIGSNRLLASEDPGAKFGSFPEALLTGYLTSIEQDVVHLAAITQTPAHYLMGKMINLAADAIKAAEVGLVSKTKRRALHIGEAYEEAMRLALGIVGSPAATNVEAETIWADMETRSLGQVTDAAVKMDTLGVPREVLWAKLGASPQEIEEWKAMNAANPPPPPPPAPVPPVPPVPEPAPEPAPEDQPAE